MAYITARELRAVVPDQYRDAALADEGTVPDAGLLAAVIDTACQEVDALIEGRVNLPISDPPKKLKTAAIYVALEILFIRRGVDLPEAMAAKIQWWRTWLSKVGAGELRLQASADELVEKTDAGAIVTLPSVTGTFGIISALLVLFCLLARPAQAIDARAFAFVAPTNPLFESPDYVEWSQAESVSLRYAVPSADSRDARWEVSDPTNLWINLAPAKSGTNWTWNPAPTQTCLPAGRYRGRVAIYDRQGTNLVFHRVLAIQDIRVHAARDPAFLVAASPLSPTDVFVTAQQLDVAIGGIAAVSNLAKQAYSLSESALHRADIWVDLNTNYFFRLPGMKKSATTTSFSEAVNICMAGFEGSVGVIHLGESPTVSGSSEIPYEIDGPITNNGTVSGLMAVAFVGGGNRGTKITIKKGYEGQLFMFTNMVSILRFESLRFQDTLSSGNENPVIDTCATELVMLECEFTNFKGSAVRHRANPSSSWNIISRCWFLGQRSVAPNIDLIAPTGSGGTTDFQFVDNICNQYTTNPILQITGRVFNLQVLGSRFSFVGNVDMASSAIYFAGGRGAVVNDNSFFNYGASSTPIRFEPASSNNFLSTVSDNNFGGSYATNSIWIGEYAHAITVVGNQLDNIFRTSTVAVNENSRNIWILNKAGDIKDPAARSAVADVESNLTELAETVSGITAESLHVDAQSTQTFNAC